MRSSTVLSLLIAIVLAGVAVVGARTWLDTERREFAASLLQQAEEKPVEKQTIVVAANQLAFGERLTRDRLREIDWASDVIPEGSFAKIEDVITGESDDEARFVVASMAPGEMVLNGKITVPGQRAKLSTALSPGMKAISIRVNDVLGVAGFVLPGDRVDVMLTRRNRSDASKSYVDVLLQGVKVLAIDQIADDRKDQPSVVRTVTFEVNTPEAQKLALGASVGTLSLALRNFASSDFEEIQRVTLEDLGDIDVAEDLLEKAQPEEPAVDEFARIEELLKGFSGDLSERIGKVEESLQGEERVVEKEVVVEKIIEVEKPVQLPVKRVVGVIRNGQRAEYRVDPEEVVE